MVNYELVTIRKFDGIENGAYSWIFLSYAVVIRKGNKAVCLRDENIEYEYIPLHNESNVKEAYRNLKIGDIKVFYASDREFDNIKFKTKSNILKYMEKSPFYFDDDTKYGRNILEDKPKIKMISNK